MLCKQCEKDLKDKDFYKSDICYKCVFKNKIAIFSTYVKKFKLCRICKSKIPPGKDVYCCEGCAKEGKLLKDRQYWFRKFCAPKVNWKN